MLSSLSFFLSLVSFVSHVRSRKQRCYATVVTRSYACLCLGLYCRERERVTIEGCSIFKFSPPCGLLLSLFSLFFFLLLFTSSLSLSLFPPPSSYLPLYLPLPILSISTTSLPVSSVCGVTPWLAEIVTLPHAACAADVPFSPPATLLCAESRHSELNSVPHSSSFVPSWRLTNCLRTSI
jgi:hypothetical protein